MATFVDKLLIAIGVDPKEFINGTRRIDGAVDHTDAKIKELQHHAADSVKHMIMGLAAPLLATFSVGKVIQGYISDVAQVAEQTGAYSKKAEEARLKQAMLQRVTKEDIELYKRGREALVKFQIATADFGAALMRTAMPALKWLLDKLNGFTDWFSHNQSNIIRFLQVLASVITVALIPSVVKFTAALLKNPLAWVVMGIAALAIAIDDLIVYLQGGRSEFDAFWKWLGFTKGDTETLAKAMTWLKTSGMELAKGVAKVTAAFIGMKAVFSVIGMLQKAWQVFSLVVLANPIVAALSLVAVAAYMLYTRWDAVCEGAEALWEDLGDFMSSWGRGIKDGVMALGSDIADFFADFGQGIARDLRRIADFFSRAWDGIVNGASHVIGRIADVFSGIAHAVVNELRGIRDGAVAVFDSIADFASSTWQGMKDGASALVDDAASALGTLWQGMKDGAGAAVDSVHGAFDGVGSWFNTRWTEMREGASAVFDSLKTFASGAWSGIKGGASTLVDDIENVFNGLTSWFSNLWEKITGVFGSALDGIKSGLGSVADFLGIGGGDSKKQGNAGLSPEQFEKQKTEILKNRQAREAQGTQPIARASAAPVSRPVPITVQIQQAKMAVTPMALGMGRAQAVRAPAVNSSTVSNVRNSSTSSTVNDNRRQEVNITVNGNADSRTAQQIGTNVTDVFKSGAMSPVAG